MGDTLRTQQESLDAIVDQGTSLITETLTPTIAAGGVQFTTALISDKFPVLVKAGQGNVGVIQLAGTEAGAESATLSFHLEAGEGVSLKLDTTDRVWVAAPDSNNDTVSLLAEEKLQA